MEMRLIPDEVATFLEEGECTRYYTDSPRWERAGRMRFEEDLQEEVANK